MKLGTEDKKKTALAAGLTLVALVTVYVNLFSGSGSAPARPRPAAPPRAEAPIPAQTRPSRGVAAVQSSRATRSRRIQSNNFEPIWQQSHDQEFDPLAADPTLRTDLLAAVRDVPMSRYSRNIFQFGQRKAVEQPLSAAEIAEAARRAEPPKPAEPPPAIPVAPSAPAARQAPRLAWKYYGFASPSGNGQRRAFLLDGDDVLIGGEGDVFRSRYKVKRIGLTSIVVEDLEYSEEQTLPIAAPAS